VAKEARRVKNHSTLHRRANVTNPQVSMHQTRPNRCALKDSRDGGYNLFAEVAKLVVVWGEPFAVWLKGRQKRSVS
jgi:hypothetical protein